MNGLSDLELVAQAMSTSDRARQSTANGTAPNPRPHINGTTNGTISSSSSAPSQGTAISEPAPTRSRSTTIPGIPDDIDLSSLSPEELQILQPLLSALSLSAERQGEGDEGDELQIQSILAQLEAADGVADDLESKLDKLLETLGGVEKEIAVVGGDAERGDAIVRSKVDDERE
ncbi:hypothetical protein IAR55_000504 [Kwoniella newhampshirensis]|uniref:Mediator of RNA polymerase II transcription subunit 21 n=1 Tax=Kwoniella newhampshirensis TaxID=1651941 RepID=A0AAW0Z734_9TREE